MLQTYKPVSNVCSNYMQPDYSQLTWDLLEDHYSYITLTDIQSDRACELCVVLPDARRDLEYLLSGTLCNELRIQHDSMKRTNYDIIKQNERTNFAHSTFILLPAHTVIMHVLNTVKIYSGKYKNKQ